MSFVCVHCKEEFDSFDLREFKQMGEKYYKDKGTFVCPDCYDYFEMLDLEEQFKSVLDC